MLRGEFLGTWTLTLPLPVCKFAVCALMCVAHMGGRLPSGSGSLGHWYCSILVGWGVVYANVGIQDLVGSHWPETSSSDVKFLTSHTVDHRLSLLCFSGMQ